MIDSGPSFDDDMAVVNPIVNARSPKLGPVALMVSPKSDLNFCRDHLYPQKDDFYHLYLSRLYYPPPNRTHPSLVGPMVGAPYASMVLESLVAWGCRQIFFFGWCGSISGRLRAGDIIIPTEAMIDEGTSRHYCNDTVESVRPAANLVKALLHTFDDLDTDIHQGSVWTTDGVYRETRAKVRHYQSKGIVGVEMELSALLSVGAYRSVDVAGVLVVSDELSTLTWRPGFKTSQFQTGRIAALKGLLYCSQGLTNR